MKDYTLKNNSEEHYKTSTKTVHYGLGYGKLLFDELAGYDMADFYLENDETSKVDPYTRVANANDHVIKTVNVPRIYKVTLDANGGMVCIII